ncbi:MAG: hypothetical protein JW786_08970 [Desulfobacterales bacterium]|nr:hypothetical protein [Desulfobacterales bacterium]
MTSKTEKEAFVWIWLPDETNPVVAGRLCSTTVKATWIVSVIANLRSRFTNPNCR